MKLSLALEIAGNQLQDYDDTLQVYQTARTQDWDSLSMAGPAAESARENLHRYIAELQEPSRQADHAAAILYAYAALQRQQEKLLERVTRFFGDIDTYPLAGHAQAFLLDKIRGLGEALDFACAAELSAMCNPELNRPPQRLGDVPELSLPALHELNYAMADTEVQELLDAHPDTLLLEVSEGRMVALVAPEGLSTEPAQITTFVPGVNSSDASGWSGQLERGRALAQNTGGATAVWLGYQAPKHALPAVNSQPAQAAAQELTRFQKSLRQRFPTAQSTLIGYSYGSVVAGYAAATSGEAAGGKRKNHHQLADDLVYVGSPGIPAEGANPPGIRTWAATNAHDPIGLATGPFGGIHGIDPSHPLSGIPELPGANELPGDHSSYWDDPAFLEGLRKISKPN
ncbi:Alpha/beta hydrolase [Corynebacterium camporealensis]|nr:Alpha/beta hydrolase [Corynebacterium camporealensis]